MTLAADMQRIDLDYSRQRLRRHIVPATLAGNFELMRGRE